MPDVQERVATAIPGDENVRTTETLRPEYVASAGLLAAIAAIITGSELHHTAIGLAVAAFCAVVFLWALAKVHD